MSIVTTSEVGRKIMLELAEKMHHNAFIELHTQFCNGEVTLNEFNAKCDELSTIRMQRMHDILQIGVMKNG